MENSEEEKTYKVVLTGFGPFRDIKVNESWLAVKERRIRFEFNIISLCKLNF